MDYQGILDEIFEEIQPFLNQGQVANYIPALQKVNGDDFAMSIRLLNGESYHVGCHNKTFSIQSISKVFTFCQALSIYGGDIYSRVGREPSGNPFNSLVQLEYERGIPRNPFINAGAIVTTDALISYFNGAQGAYDCIESFIHTLSDSPIHIDQEIYESELQNGYRNMALIHLMKSFGNIHNDVEEVIQTYFKHCSIRMSTQQLCYSMLFLANHGINPLNHEIYLNEKKAKRINSLMLTCGHYDASGDFAFHVGLPGKSGVGGGIVAVIPGVMSLCVYSPRLNKQGNSLAGTKALELFTSKTQHSIF